MMTEILKPPRVSYLVRSWPSLSADDPQVSGYSSRGLNYCLLPGKAIGVACKDIPPIQFDILVRNSHKDVGGWKISPNGTSIMGGLLSIEKKMKFQLKAKRIGTRYLVFLGKCSADLLDSSNVGVISSFSPTSNRHDVDAPLIRATCLNPQNDVVETRRASLDRPSGEIREPGPAMSPSKHLAQILGDFRGITSQPDSASAVSGPALVACKSFLRNGKMKECIELLRALRDAELPLDDISFRPLLNVLANEWRTLIRKCKVAEAQNFLRQVAAAGISAQRLVRCTPAEVLSAVSLRLLHQSRASDCVGLLACLKESGNMSVEHLVAPQVVLTSCMKEGGVGLALGYISLLPPLSGFYNAAIMTCGKHGDMDGAYAVKKTMESRGILPDMYTWRSLIDASAHCRMPARARQIFQEMMSEGVQPNLYVYNSLLSALHASAGGVRQIRAQMRADGIRPDRTTYNVLLKSYCATRQTDAAAELYARMKSQAAASGEPLDNITYCSMIKVFALAKMCEAALSVHADMLSAGVPPSVVTWTALLRACTATGHVEQAFALFEEMQAAGCAPNTVTFNVLIDACVEAGQQERAHALLNEMEHWSRQRSESTRPNSGRDEEWQSGKLPGNSSLPRSQGIVQGSLESAESSSISEKAAPSLDDQSEIPEDLVAARDQLCLSPDTFSAATCPAEGTAGTSSSELQGRQLTKAAGSGLSQTTETLLAYSVHSPVGSVTEMPGSDRDEEMVGQEASMEIAGEALNSVSSMPDEDSAQSAVPWRDGSGAAGPEASSNKRSSRKQRRRRANCRPDVITYNTLMKASAMVPERALAVLQEMQRQGLTPTQESWCTLLDAYGSIGDLPGALKVAEEMQQAGISFDIIAYTALIKACVTAGDNDRAFAMLEKMRAAKLRPNLVTYTTLLRQRSSRQLSDVQRALAVYDDMRTAGYSPNDYLLKCLLEEWAEGAVERRSNLGGVGVGSSPPPSLTDVSGAASCTGLQVHEEGAPESSRALPELMLQLVQKASASSGSSPFLGRQGGSISPRLEDGGKGAAAMDLMTVDLHGLSRAEGRTVVLAVLRILKERHGQGLPVLGDLVIITGSGRHSKVPGLSVVRSSVLHVLQVELGLSVNAEPPSPAPLDLMSPLEGFSSVVKDWDQPHFRPLSSGPATMNDLKETEAECEPILGSSAARLSPRDQEEVAQATWHGENKFELVATMAGPVAARVQNPEFIARRPANHGRLVVRKESLVAWLNKKRTP